MHRLMAAFLFVAVTVQPVWSLDRIWSAERAHQAATTGEIILLDIRTPEEWDETGIGAGAWPVSMHTPDFGANITAILSNNPDVPIGLICATGGRSDYLLQLLAQNNFTNVFDVNEGMMGSGRGPGWIKKNLPIVTRAAAEAAMPKAFKMYPSAN